MRALQQLCHRASCRGLKRTCPGPPRTRPPFIPPPAQAGEWAPAGGRAGQLPPAAQPEPQRVLGGPGHAPPRCGGSGSTRRSGALPCPPRPTRQQPLARGPCHARPGPHGSHPSPGALPCPPRPTRQPPRAPGQALSAGSAACPDPRLPARGCRAQACLMPPPPRRRRPCPSWWNPADARELETLDVSGCSSLTSLATASPALGALSAQGCGQLVRLELQGHPRQLALLQLANCGALRDVVVPAAAAAAGGWVFGGCGRPPVGRPVCLLAGCGRLLPSSPGTQVTTSLRANSVSIQCTTLEPGETVQFQAHWGVGPGAEWCGVRQPPAGGCALQAQLAATRHQRVSRQARRVIVARWSCGAAAR